jgi:hypothetical protein
MPRPYRFFGAGNSCSIGKHEKPTPLICPLLDSLHYQSRRGAIIWYGIDAHIIKRDVDRIDARSHG